jgi:uncharacterized membrane protein
MVQGHTLDVLLAPGYRDGIVYKVWLFLRGLTAPVFFILSGVSFTVSTTKYWDRYSQRSWKLLRRLGRFAFFIFLGYVMHLPAARWQDFRYVDAQGWQGWFQVDVLQCIGLTLLFLQLLVLFSGEPARFARWTALGSAAVILATPLFWAFDWSRVLPLPIASYLSARSGSYFPLFPWTGYVMFGAALGSRLRQWSAIPELRIRNLATLGGTLAVGGLLAILPFTWLYPKVEFWTTSPSLFMIRAACVCLILAFFSYVTTRFPVPERACRALAQESLVVYFVHLSIVYGSIWNLGLRQIVGATLSPLPTIGAVCLLLFSMVLMAWAWNWCKRAGPATRYALRLAVLLFAVYRPWAP